MASILFVEIKERDEVRALISRGLKLVMTPSWKSFGKFFGLWASIIRCFSIYVMAFFDIARFRFDGAVNSLVLLASKALIHLQ